MKTSKIKLTSVCLLGLTLLSTIHLQASADELTDASNKVVELQKEANSKLVKSKSIQFEIDGLNAEINARQEKLESQARSQQTNSVTRSFVNTMLDSKNLTDLVTKIVAINTLTQSSEDLLNEQKDAKKELEELKDKNAAEIKKANASLDAAREHYNTLNEQEKARIKAAEEAEGLDDITTTATAVNIAEPASEATESTTVDSNQATESQENISTTVTTPNTSVASSNSSSVSNSTASNSASTSSTNGKTSNTTASKPSTASNYSSAIVNEAMKYIGVPYVWGGTTPSGFDCSGFTQWVYSHATGMRIGRSTYNQIANGRMVPLSQARVGDTLYMSNGAHTGIYLGNGKMIDAPKPGSSVGIHNIWDSNAQALQFY